MTTNKWTLEVKEDPETGDAIIEFPDDLMKQAGWKEGDEIVWTEGENGSYVLTTKKESVKMESLIESNGAYNLRVTKEECYRPKGLFRVCFIRDLKDVDGNVESSSEYEFFLVQEQLDKLGKVLAS